MLKPCLSAASSRLAAGIAVVALAIGCDASIEEQILGRNAPKENELATDTIPAIQGDQSTRNAIVSDGPITVENGKVTYGRPTVTEDVEKKIYLSLSQRRDLARSIEERVSGGNRGSRQMREEYELVTKAFMMQYDLSEADIAAIIRKGDQQGWK